VMFNSYVKLPEGNYDIYHDISIHYKTSYPNQLWKVSHRPRNGSWSWRPGKHLFRNHAKQTAFCGWGALGMTSVQRRGAKISVGIRMENHACSILKWSNDLDENWGYPHFFRKPSYQQNGATYGALLRTCLLTMDQLSDWKNGINNHPQPSTNLCWCVTSNTMDHISVKHMLWQLWTW
jgi:hypothetical protein